MQLLNNAGSTYSDTLPWQLRPRRTHLWKQRRALCSKHLLLWVAKDALRRAIKGLSHAEPASALAVAPPKAGTKRPLSQAQNCAWVTKTPAGSPEATVAESIINLSKLNSNQSTQKARYETNERDMPLELICQVNDRHREALNWCKYCLASSSSWYNDQVARKVRK